MTRRIWLSGLLLLLAAVTGVQAQSCPPACAPKGPFWRKQMPRYLQPTEPAPVDPSAPPTTPPDPSAPPSTDMGLQDAFASAGQGGTGSPASYVPGMFGDLLGGCVGVQGVSPNRGTSGQTFTVCMPSPEQAASFKIAESDSPRPQNRFYYNFNYLGNINVDVLGTGAPRAQLYRHLLGFEKTLLDGNASVGLRLPFLKIGGAPGYQESVIGDMSILLKYALANNPDTGNILSSGLSIKVPTGENAVFYGANGQRTQVQPRFNDVYFQPWGGYIYYLTPALYVHGFHSVSIPTVGADVLYMSNDVGVGYWLLRDAGGSILRGVVPTFEVHANTPFRNRTLPNIVLMPDQVSLTMGAYFMFMRGTLGGAVGVPVAGLHTIEALASYTMRW